MLLFKSMIKFLVIFLMMKLSLCWLLQVQLWLLCWNITKQQLPSFSNNSEGNFEEGILFSKIIKSSFRYIPEYSGSEEQAGNSVSDDDVGPFPCSQTSSSSQVVPDSPCSVGSDCSGSWIGIPRIKKNWIDVVTVPLLMSYMTRYIFGTDKLRPSAFEVRGMDGSSTGVIHHEDPTLLTQMTKLITDYIGLQNAHQASKLNRCFSSTNQISFMTWVAEGIINNDHPWQNW